MSRSGSVSKPGSFHDKQRGHLTLGTSLQAKTPRGVEDPTQPTSDGAPHATDPAKLPLHQNMLMIFSLPSPLLLHFTSDQPVLLAGTTEDERKKHKRRTWTSCVLDQPSVTWDGLPCWTDISMRDSDSCQQFRLWTLGDFLCAGGPR